MKTLEEYFENLTETQIISVTSPNGDPAHVHQYDPEAIGESFTSETDGHIHKYDMTYNSTEYQDDHRHVLIGLPV